MIRGTVSAAAALALASAATAQQPPARNVILLVGDGMGVSTVTATFRGP